VLKPNKRIVKVITIDDMDAKILMYLIVLLIHCPSIKNILYYPGALLIQAHYSI
jgi:hypothetical protein